MSSEPSPDPHDISPRVVLGRSQSRRSRASLWEAAAALAAQSSERPTNGAAVVMMQSSTSSEPLVAVLSDCSELTSARTVVEEDMTTTTSQERQQKRSLTPTTTAFIFPPPSDIRAAGQQRHDAPLHSVVSPLNVSAATSSSWSRNASITESSLPAQAPSPQSMTIGDTEIAATCPQHILKWPASAHSRANNKIHAEEEMSAPLPCAAAAQSDPTPQHPPSTSTTIQAARSSSSPPNAHRQRSATAIASMPPAATSASADAGATTTIVAHLRTLLQERNIAVSKLNDEVTLLKAAARDASREHEASTMSLRAEVSSLEVKIRMIHLDNDGLRMKLRQADDRLHSEIARHRDCRNQLTASEKELLVLRQTIDLSAKHADQGNRVLREKLNDSRKQLAETQRQLRDAQQLAALHEHQANSNENPAAANTAQDNVGLSFCEPPASTSASSSPTNKVKPSSSSTITNPVSVLRASVLAGAHRRGSTVAGSRSGATFPSQRETPATTAISTSAGASGLPSTGHLEQQQPAPSTATILETAHAEEVNRLLSTIERLSSEQKTAQDGLTAERILQQEKLSALEEELRQTMLRENEWKLRLDDLTDTYEAEVSRLSSQLSKWREEQSQQQAALLSARSRTSVPPTAAAAAALSLSRANSMNLADHNSNSHHQAFLVQAHHHYQHQHRVVVSPGTPIPSAGPASTVATPTAAPSPLRNLGSHDESVTYGGTYGYAYSPEISDPPSSAAMLMAVGTEAQLREHIRDLDDELLSVRDKCTLLEESRRGLLNDIASLRESLALYEGPWGEETTSPAPPGNGSTTHRSHTSQSRQAPLLQQRPVVAGTVDDDDDLTSQRISDDERQQATTATNVSTTAGVHHHHHQPLLRRLQEEISFLRRQLHLGRWFEANNAANQNLRLHDDHGVLVVPEDALANVAQRVGEGSRQGTDACPPRPSAAPPRPVARQQFANTDINEQTISATLLHRLPSPAVPAGVIPQRQAPAPASTTPPNVRSIAEHKARETGSSFDDKGDDTTSTIPGNDGDTQSPLQLRSRRQRSASVAAAVRGGATPRRQLVVTVPEVSSATVGVMLASAIIGGAVAVTLGARR
ncbi:GPI-anchored surface protein, putative [Bodo saltans]|uniref:GPI-anchored surface protein, putative n=1 Tax=Bodo saltans TaxID=75058 RepID=A0A0S4JNL1_BODSA|nr:GPI-anchored surface protein, putative [Bodo saltans]|eukprot:CUG93152.1 GPI-anchored surface protein, putative [Bodo saltans]